MNEYISPDINVSPTYICLHTYNIRYCQNCNLIHTIHQHTTYNSEKLLLFMTSSMSYDLINRDQPIHFLSKVCTYIHMNKHSFIYTFFIFRQHVIHIRSLIKSYYVDKYEEFIIINLNSHIA